MNKSNTGCTRLVISEVFPPRIGGSGHWLHEIYSRLPSEQSVFLVGKTEGDRIFDKTSKLRIVRTRMDTIVWTFLTFQGIAYFFRLIRTTLKLHKQYKFTEIHCGRVLPEGIIGLVCSWMTGARLVCYIHGEDIEISRDSREHRYLTQLVLFRADILICNCHHSKRLLQNSWQCNENNIRVLHPRTDTTLFKPDTERETSRLSLGWQGRKVLLTVSRLNERKGHDKLLKALPEIIKAVPETLYIIAGEGVYDEFGTYLQKLVVELKLEKHVVFTGACDLKTLIKYYQCCDLFVLPNLQIGGNLEGFGIVLLEAQSCGRPVIAGNSGGTVETMQPGKSGLLVDCSKHENLVEPVVKLLLNDALLDEMGNFGRHLMLNNFSWSTFDDVTAESVFSAYSGISAPVA